MTSPLTWSAEQWGYALVGASGLVMMSFLLGLLAHGLVFTWRDGDRGEAIFIFCVLVVFVMFVVGGALIGDGS